MWQQQNSRATPVWSLSLCSVLLDVTFLKNKVISFYKPQTEKGPASELPGFSLGLRTTELTNLEDRGLAETSHWQMPAPGGRCCSELMSEALMNGVCRALQGLRLTAPRCALLPVPWRMGQETEDHRPQNPSATLLQQDRINDHGLHIAPVSIYPLWSCRQLSRRLCSQWQHAQEEEIQS